MSNDFMEGIWSQFAVESEEHLEVMEQILVAAERAPVGADEVARLFRSFHSVKGLCKALDLLSMEKLAHRAEDLLGLIRDGSAILDIHAASLLLEAVDGLKMLHVKAVVERADGIASPELLARLADAFLASGGKPYGDVASVPPLAVDIPAVEEICDTGISLHEDPDMFEFFMDLVRENMAALTVLIWSDSDVDLNSAELHGNMLSAVETIAHASDAMGFIRIKDVMDVIVDEMSREGDAPLQNRRIVAHLLEYLELMRFIEKESGKRAAESVLADYLIVPMRVKFVTLFKKLNGDIEAISAVSDRREGKVKVVDEALAEALSRDLSEAKLYLTLLLPDANSDLLLLLEDVYGRAARGELSICREIVAMTREVLSLVESCYDASVSGIALNREEDEKNHAALGERIRSYVWTHESGGSEKHPVEEMRDLVAKLKINADLAEILSPENVRDLLAAVKEGWHVYEVSAHLESSEEVATDFLGWVDKCGKVITNRSEFIDGNSWYEMLLVSALNRQQVESALLAINPSGDLIKLAPYSDDADIAQIASAVSSGQVALLPSITSSATSASGSATLGAAVAASASSGVIRVAGETLDSFMNQIGEMVLVRAQLNYAINNDKAKQALISLKGIVSVQNAMTGRRESDHLIADVCEMFEAQARKLAEVDALIQSALLRLQDSAMALRVVPMETVFKRFPRLVRDLAQSQGKNIRLEQLGQEVKIDKAMVEVLSDPLMHMVRNSADHGIESPEARKAAGKPVEAQIVINALQQGSRILVQVSDDGRGIDTEKVRKKAVERGLIKEEESRHLSSDDIYNFLFLPGFSTAEKVTETSGRGVGMDVVRNNVMRLGGSIHIKSELGRGSTFTMEMPLSAAVQEVMLISVAGQTLALPGRYVNEVVEIEQDSIQSVKGRQAVLLRGTFLPLVYMGDLLGFPRMDTSVSRYRTAVVISNGQQMIGVEVDKMIGRRELFVKDIHHRLAALPGVGGASILGDGKVVLILDGEALLHLAEHVAPRHHNLVVKADLELV